MYRLLYGTIVLFESTINGSANLRIYCLRYRSFYHPSFFYFLDFLKMAFKVGPINVFICSIPYNLIDEHGDHSMN